MPFRDALIAYGGYDFKGAIGGQIVEAPASRERSGVIDFTHLPEVYGKPCFLADNWQDCFNCTQTVCVYDMSHVEILRLRRKVKNVTQG